MSEKDHSTLLAILDAISKILNFTVHTSNADAFFADEKTFDATLLNFVVIGEMTVKLSKKLKKTHPHIPWVKIKDFRNIVAHDYFGVDAEEVWQIIQNHIPILKQEIKKITETEEE